MKTKFLDKLWNCRLLLIAYAFLACCYGWIPIQYLSVKEQVLWINVIMVPVWIGFWLWDLKNGFSDISVILRRKKNENK